jgi:3-oxoadipate enol-lactonase
VHPAAGARMAQEQPALYFLYRELDALSGGVDKESLRRQLGAMRTTPAESVAALTTPVLCITGAEDVVVPPAAVEAFASLLPSARLARVLAAGHSVYFERPDVFNHLVDDFLAVTDSAFASR